MSAISDIYVNFMNKKEGEWFDQNLRRNVKGTIHYYEVLHKGSGIYLVQVSCSDEDGKIVVGTALTDENTSTHDQLKRRSIVFNRGRNENTYYHPLSHSYSENGRIRYKRIVSEDELPAEIRDNFLIDKYENVSPKDPTSSLRGKLVVEVPKDKLDKMVLLYALEKILPAFNLGALTPMPSAPPKGPEFPESA